MSRVAVAIMGPPEAARPRPPAPSLFGRLERRYFDTPSNAVVTLIVLAAMALAAAALCRWAILEAVFTAQSPRACHAARGACWATVRHHARVVFLGLYPPEQQWRAWAAIAVFAAAGLLVGLGLLRGAKAPLAAIAIAWTAFELLMGGGALGLSPVPIERWGGLPLTIHAFLCSVAIGFPLAVVLAVGREARLPAIRWACGALVETIRAVPLLTVLFCAAVVAPLMIPGVLAPTKITRVILGLALFYACYQAEVIRGGMRAIPPAETEGATALGLTRFQTLFLIVLPQAIRLTIPSTVNLVVVAFKDTSLIVVVGLFDFLAAANTAIASDAWAPFFGEIYLTVALTYLAIAGGLSWLGRLAERRLAVIR